MDKKRRFTLLVRLVVAHLLLAACGAPQPASTPLPPTPTPISRSATAGPAPETALEPMTSEPPSTSVRRKVMYFNIPYMENGGRQQTLSIYLPKDAPKQPQQTYPVLFLAHGYTMGKDTRPLWDVIQFANNRGLAAVAIDYRDDLETGGAWPAHHDAACALAWVYAYADDYGLEVDHMVGFGNSYGVSLIANLAMADDPGFFLSECPNTSPETRPFSGVVGFGAGTFGLSGPEMTFATKEVAEMYEEFGIFDGSANEILATMQAISEVDPREWAAHGALGEEERRMAQVHPAYWADPGDPPFLILTGDHDLDFWTLRDRAGFAEWLQGLGVEATHVLLPNSGHTTFGRDASAWQGPLDEFLDQVVEN